jgi:uncharacterized membrane protein
VGEIPGSRHDPYPYILLNLFLSMLAALQGAIILISQKRADQIASEDAHHTLQNTELLKQLLEQNTELTKQVHQLVCRELEGQQRHTSSERSRHTRMPIG